MKAVDALRQNYAKLPLEFLRLRRERLEDGVADSVCAELGRLVELELVTSMLRGYARSKSSAAVR